MGRRYAAILGSLAFATTLLRGLLYQRGLEATLWAAMGQLLQFAVIGGVIGAWAAWIVADSVYDRIAAEAAEQKGTRG